MKNVRPYLIILLGLFLLLMGMPLPAGVCFLIGFVTIIDGIWPEDWGMTKMGSNKK